MNAGEKRRSIPVVAWIACILILLLFGLAVGTEILFSLKDYSIVQGLSGSPWTGFASFASLFAFPSFGTLLINSALLSIVPLLGAVVLGTAAAWFVPRIRGKASRAAAMGVLLMPAFVPSVCWAMGMMPTIRGNLGTARLLYILVTAVSGASLIGFAGAAYAMADPGRGIRKGIGTASLLFAFLTFAGNVELLSMIQSPASYRALDILDTYAYRIAFEQWGFGTGAAAYVLRALLGLPVGAAACVIARWALGRQGRPIDTVLREQAGIPFAVWAIPVGILAISILLLLKPELSFQEERYRLSKTLPAQLVSTLLGGLAAFGIAWALISALRAAPGTVFWILAGLLLAFMGPTLGAYFWVRKLGWINTFVPAVLFGLFTPQGIMLTLLPARLPAQEGFRERPAWLLALLPACYALAHVWGGSYASLLYMTRVDTMSWGMLLRMQLASGGAGDALTYGLVLVPALLLAMLAGFLVQRTFEDSEP